ncbi:hypothetical protein [Methylovirgula sp. HY1]|uniref:hypothetical protein n=1 Tax=Methylovirgula sp. HY1 TaxID=2822761 RepID=UPI001C5B4BC6|nr:hypothetical protein [Methylovirgula sp. HY1]QXX74201.1 hypothetical protein MHY1_01011 [Methylovirgula sp. HY1]
MTAKIEMVRKLGEQALLLPGLLADALAANDRLKLRLTLLQEAVAHCRDPAAALRNFAAERRAAGLADPQYDVLVSGARALSADRILVPGGKELLKGIAADLATMLAPLEANDAAASRTFDERLMALVASMPAAEDDELSIQEVERMTSARRGDADSVHLLVMDAHRAINVLAAETAVETIDDARVHHVTDADRACIKAFMAGLNRTAGLAFGHPGLGTTAVRVGTLLTIQNDIGTTDAHVLVVHVGDQNVSVTYTDVHRLRAKFFIALFDGHEVDWSPLAEQSAQALANQDVFYLVTGHYAAADTAALYRFLEFLGSRIVFLIDWNKARKALQTFVGKEAAVEILNWAALHDYGHRAFLELGGVDLVFEAIRRTATGRIPYGARLDETLGIAASVNFLRHVLSQTSEGLRAGRSIRLIRDEIQADLAQLFDTAESSVLTVLMRHLGITRMLAAALAEAFAEDRMAANTDRSQLARIAKRMEEKADRLTLEAREICARMQRADRLRQTIDEVENATDMLDEGAFLLSLVPQGDGVARIGVLADLADMVIESVGQLIRAVEAASRLPEGQRGDAADALRAIDVVMLAERRADAAEREAFSAFMRVPCSDARALVLGLEIARALETATDHLAHAALALRDLVLEELSA